MGADKCSVVKVRGVDPEVFWVIWLDAQSPKGSFARTSQNLTEGQVRAELKVMGHNDSDIDRLIKEAREEPK
jgi:hypothetical protein